MALQTPHVLHSGPRWGTPRRLDRPSRGGLDRQVAKLLGWDLFPWQSGVVDVAGEYDPITRIPFYRTVGVSVSRQNGKTTLVCSRIARQLIAPRQTVAYTAQDRGLARTKWDEHIDALMQTPFAERVDRIDRTNHREMLVMQNGSRYMPVTPHAKKAGRSFSIDLAILDEAHAHPNLGVLAAIGPAMAAKPLAQIWLLSNAGDSNSGLWKHYTDLGRLEADNPDSTMCWIEYAPDELIADQFDHNAWAAANPSLGMSGGVLESALADGALTMDRDTFFREHLNIWMDSEALRGIDAVTWAACRRDDLAVGEEVCFALDLTPERDRGTLCAAGKLTNDDGETITPLEIIETGTNIDLLIRRAAEVANAWNAHIVIDRTSPAASAIPASERATHYEDRKLEKKGKAHRVQVIPLTELTRACGDFYDAAVHSRLSHQGDYRLTDAVTSATKRQAGEAWRWDRRGMTETDITPLVASTLARWGIITTPPPAIKSYSAVSFG